MKLVLTAFRYALVDELFRYKASGFSLPPFPGYDVDQWGIKAHNRPWIADEGAFQKGQRVLEVGGAYSTLPAALAERHGVDAWVADDFGASIGEEDLYTRWGDPRELPRKHPGVRYVFEALGASTSSLQDGSFDRVFSVSTLEHIGWETIPAVFEHMNRLLAPGGRQLHTIDIPMESLRSTVAATAEEAAWARFRAGPSPRRTRSTTLRWMLELERSGVDTGAFRGGAFPLSMAKLSSAVLKESYDVVYRLYPPNNAPKPYAPSVSLLVEVRRER